MSGMHTEGYPFHKANIHEKRFVAILCRAVPALSVITVTTLVLYGAIKEQMVLLWTVAIMNTSIWLWVVTTSIQCIYATLVFMNRLEEGPRISKETVGGAARRPISPTQSADGDTGGSSCGNGVVHLIILPNYKEDELMLVETLRSLAEAEESNKFMIVLAMEAREGKDGKDKALRLQMRFESDFAHVFISYHPADLLQEHEDGSEFKEVPGKASNLKWAVNQAFIECTEHGIHHDRVVLTVADADCIMHPRYFSQVGREFAELRQIDDHHWTMWQAPQFPYRNWYTSPIVSRVWSYIQSTYETGCLGGAAWGAHTMTFSSYSMPLLLVHNAEAWDGDVIADDHHSFLKCFYYWLHTNADKQIQNGTSIMDQPRLRIQPVWLPVKSTSVQNEIYLKSYSDRWSQAKRHAQGVAELSYSLLATYDACRTCLWPHGLFDIRLLARMVQVNLRIWCMHCLPICQSISLATLSVKWLLYRGDLDMCPERLWFFGDVLNVDQFEQFFLCGFAGAWVLTWPIVVPWCLIVISNTLMMYKVFLKPTNLNRYASIWHSEDGRVPNQSLGRTILTIVGDCMFGLAPLMLIYGILVELIAYVNILLFGNSFEFIPGNKGIWNKKTTGGYGTLDQLEKNRALPKVSASPPKIDPISIE